MPIRAAAMAPAAGQYGVHREIDGRAGCHHAAVPLHDEKLVVQPRAAQVL